MNIDTKQIIDAAAAMPFNEKLKLYDTIKDEIIQYRIENLFKEFRSDEISDEEITAIVENVRSERNKSRR